PVALLQECSRATKSHTKGRSAPSRKLTQDSAARAPPRKFPAAQAQCPPQLYNPALRLRSKSTAAQPLRVPQNIVTDESFRFSRMKNQHSSVWDDYRVRAVSGQLEFAARKFIRARFAQKKKPANRGGSFPSEMNLEFTRRIFRRTSCGDWNHPT